MTTPSPSLGTGDSDLSALLEQIRAGHQQHVSRSYPAPGICIRADGEWPCDTARLLAAIDAVLELADTLTDDVVLTSELRTRLREAIRTSLAGDSSNEKETGDEQG